MKAVDNVKVLVYSGLASTLFSCSSNLLLLLVFKIGILGYLISNLVGHFVAIFIMFFFGKIYRDVRFTTDSKLIKEMFVYSAPLAINSVAWWINTASDKYILTFFSTGYNSYESCDYTVSVAKKVIVAREAIALTLDTETEGNFEDIDDYDRFSFTAEEDGTYIFKGTTSQMRDIYGYLYSDEAMTESFDIDGGYPSWTDYYVYFTIRVDLTAGQTVYLKPVIDDGYGSCDYTVSVKQRNAVAIEMTLNTPIPGHFENSDEFDFFSFTAPSEGTYIFTSDCYYDTFCYLYSDEGLKEILALNDDDGGNGQFKIECYLEEGFKDGVALMKEVQE